VVKEERTTIAKRTKSLRHGFYGSHLFSPLLNGSYVRDSDAHNRTVGFWILEGRLKSPTGNLPVHVFIRVPVPVPVPVPVTYQ